MLLPPQSDALLPGELPVQGMVTTELCHAGLFDGARHGDDLSGPLCQLRMPREWSRKVTRIGGAETVGEGFADLSGFLERGPALGVDLPAPA